ncbi:uncharacterized protein LOC115797077 [Archocentrus centrarchus]|uniref:uncharacterized protein LOC115797077 n=1 Tax=Archocentrus centrarchus TaxID=63155 RepID=UPI0011EA44E8|nr:uncharacterized protein LOC115797077 [Archocentrus centrarchus]
MEYPAQGCFSVQTGPARNPTTNLLTSREQLGVQYPAQGCFSVQTGPARNPTTNLLTSSVKASNTTTKQEKCYKPQDKRFKFVDRDDDLDFLYEGFKSPRALMSCGHAVTPTSLTNWCLRLLEQGESRFTCGVCDAEWPFKEVRKMALLTHQEVNNFENTLAFNAARQTLTIKSCPGCRSFVEGENGSDLNVLCKVCTAQKGRPYEFCWQCLREWKGARPRKDRCDNDGCCNHSVKTLETCPEITVDEFDVCPSVRACPTCGLLLEHTTKMCKCVVCPRCKVEFCFVCLTSMYAGECCSSGVAPRQTSIPVWKKK